jgi:hypothetical protein
VSAVAVLEVSVGLAQEGGVCPVCGEPADKHVVPEDEMASWFDSDE